MILHTPLDLIQSTRLVITDYCQYIKVPYGCLVPPRVKNLLVAGRCVAGDKISHTAMRNMMACTVTGQGAGVAAAVSIKVYIVMITFDGFSLRIA